MRGELNLSFVCLVGGILNETFVWNLIEKIVKNSTVHFGAINTTINLGTFRGPLRTILGTFFRTFLETFKSFQLDSLQFDYNVTITTLQTCVN